MIPAPFRSLGTLRVLNVCAVGLALAAVVSVVSAALLDTPTAVMATGVPTWLIGTLWAWVLRWPRTVRKSSFRWGWAASVPLAMLNSGLACALAFLGMPHALPFIVSFLLGMTFGVIVWLPALLLTLLFFGAPIASAHRLAAKGLAGEERGERIVGVACFVMSALGLAMASFMPWRNASAGIPLALGFAVLGLLTGGASTVLAHAREARRRRFVTRAEAGEVPGYRIDATAEGKVLVRIVSQGNGYRVADFEEEVFELGATGEATRPRLVADDPTGRA